MDALNIIDTAIRCGTFHTFTRLLQGTSLEERLRSRDLFTLFAPLDIAFAYLTPEMFNHLLRAERAGVLSNVLGYHVVPARIMSHELASLGKAKTIHGAELTIDNIMELRVNEARVLHLDIAARNGVIHGIDRLLMPAMSAASVSV